MDFSDLPIEIVQAMFVDWTPDEIVNLCGTNKFLNDILCKSIEFWKYKIIHDFGNDGKKEIQILEGNVTQTKLVNIWKKLKNKPTLEVPSLSWLTQNTQTKRKLTGYNVFVITYMKTFGTFPPKGVWNEIGPLRDKFTDRATQYNALLGLGKIK